MSTFAWFFCIFGQATLDKLVSMATKKGLSMICKILEFQSNSLSHFRVVRHFLAVEWHGLVKSQVLENLYRYQEAQSTKGYTKTGQELCQKHYQKL